MNKNSHVPLWVRVIYSAAQAWDEFFGRVGTLMTWRFKFQDDWCSCEFCEERRARGSQKPMKRMPWDRRSVCK